MGNVQCTSFENKKVTFDMLENILNQNKSEIESRINLEYLSIKKLKDTNKCKVSKEYKIISNFIPIEKRRELFTKWIKLLGLSTLLKIRNGNEIEIEFEKILLKSYENKTKHFTELFLSGVPSSIRPSIWLILLNQEIIKRNENYYYELLHMKIPDEIKEEINKDIYRTYPNEECSEDKIKKLKNILCIIPSLDNEIGYCQGINFIVGFILKVTFFNEINCLILLSHILEKIRGYFLPDFPLLKINIYIFNKFFYKLYPKLSEHFKKLEIPNEIWIGKWLQTLFILNLPYEELCRIWDCFFIYGFDFVIPISLSIIYYLEKKFYEFNDSTELIYYFNESLNPKKIEFIYSDFDNRIFTIDRIISRAKKIFKSMNKNYIDEIKYEFGKHNNLNLQKLEKKYDINLIANSKACSTPSEFSSNKNNKRLHLRKSSFGFRKFDYYILNEDEDDEEEEFGNITNRDINFQFLDFDFKNK